MSENKAKAQLDTDHEVSSRMSMPMTHLGPATELHPEFYFDDSLVVIQVQSTLFRVHKFQLIKSETFSDMFKMPKVPSSGLEEGASREYPIALDGVKSSDFAALLKVLYADYFPANKPNCEPEIIVPAFRPAHMWNFSDLRTRLLPLVKEFLDCVDKIVLGRELDIQDWLAPAYLELCQRDESLTVEEGTKLGMQSTIMITRLREKFRPSPAPSPGGDVDYCTSCMDALYPSTSVGSNCYRCGKRDPTYRGPEIPPARSTVPLSGDDCLEAQVKKWVEGGCVTK